MNLKRQIPNAITCGNLFCGCLAIIKLFEGNLVWACYLVGIAAVLDFFDGFAARMLKVSSPIGKDLDSLADMVTFGVVPALIMFKLIDLSYIVAFTKSLNSTERGQDLWSNYQADNLIKYTGLLIAVFSCIRLAKFNNDTRQSDSFIGVPTPANTIFICGFPLIFNQLGLNFSEVNGILEKEALFQSTGNLVGMVSVYILSSPLLLASSAVVLGLLLISEIPLLALKFKHFKWQGNQVRYVFLALALLLLAGLQLVGIPLVIFLYILISIVNNIFLKTKV